MCTVCKKKWQHLPEINFKSMDKSVHIRGHTRSCCFLSLSECSLQFVNQWDTDQHSSGEAKQNSSFCLYRTRYSTDALANVLHHWRRWKRWRREKKIVCRRIKNTVDPALNSKGRNAFLIEKSLHPPKFSVQKSLLKYTRSQIKGSACG